MLYLCFCLGRWFHTKFSWGAHKTLCNPCTDWLERFYEGSGWGNAQGWECEGAQLFHVVPHLSSEASTCSAVPELTLYGEFIVYTMGLEWVGRPSKALLFWLLLSACLAFVPPHTGQDTLSNRVLTSAIRQDRSEDFFRVNLQGRERMKFLRF